MFQHGKAKEKRKEINEEERAQIEKQLNTITTINKDILKKRNSSNIEEKYDKKNLDYLYKASKLMTDSTTIWNYRKETILHMKEKISELEYYTFLQEEVKKVTGLTLGNPKSYVLWNHREWTLLQAVDYEVKNDIFNKSLLMQDLELCNMFLTKDDRNFHCWNYRLNIVLQINKFFNKHFDELLANELKYSIKMIKDSCSNFSAWHYRAKLIAIYFNKSNISWDSKEAIEYFSVDFDYLVKAIYTDPRDQSPWNYHYWLMTSFTPIMTKLVNFDSKSNILTLTLTDVVYADRVFNPAILLESNLNCLSKVISIDLNKYFELNLDSVYISYSENYDLLSILDGLVNEETNVKKLSFTKNNQRLPDIRITKNSHQVISINVTNKLHIWQSDLISRELSFVNKLIKESEGFLEFAKHRKIQLLSITLLVKKYNEKEFCEMNIQNEDDEYISLKKEISDLYNDLIENSKRCSNMFASFSKNL